MTVTPAHAAELVRDAGAAAASASSIDEAMEAIARVVSRHAAVWRASLRILVPDDQLEIVGVWCAGKTMLTVGSRMSVLASSFPDVARNDQPIVYHADTKETLLDDILRGEGVQCWVSIPMHVRGMVVGIFSISSTLYRAFGDEDVSFLAELGEAVEETLMSLARPSGTL